MEEINNLKEQVRTLEIELSDSYKKLNLNRQYSTTLEEKLNNMDKPATNNNIIMILLIIIIIFLCAKVLVLSKQKKLI